MKSASDLSAGLRAARSPRTALAATAASRSAPRVSVNVSALAAAGTRASPRSAAAAARRVSISALPAPPAPPAPLALGGYSSAAGGGNPTLQRAALANAFHLRGASPRASLSASAAAGDDETASNVSETFSAATSASGSAFSYSSGSSSSHAAGHGRSGGYGYGYGHASAASASASSPAHGHSLAPRGSNFKVVIRVRPPLPRELHGDHPFQNVIGVDASGHVLTVSENLSALATSGGDAGGCGGGSGAGAGGSASGGAAGASGAAGEPGDASDVNGMALAALSPAHSAAYGHHVFSFDHVYDQHCTQRAVYENTAKAVVESSLEGYNATIFAYGQTGTGKTYTMEGFNSGGSAGGGSAGGGNGSSSGPGGGSPGAGAGAVEERGIIPRAIEQIFLHIQANVSARRRFLVRASYLQIYNESISDLLKPERANLTIREDKKRGVFVEGLSEWVVRSPEEIYGLMERGGAMRATGSTKMNELSSRSHAVFIIIAEQSRTSYVDASGREMAPEDFTALVNAYQARHGTGGAVRASGSSASASASSGGKPKATGPHGGVALHPKLESMVRQSFKVGKLNLVDLAGSERVRLSGATGQRLEESKKINQSLSALGNVISALTDARGRQHIPYRDSKLTRILEDSLGGNCKTTMMAMISPALEAMTESLSTLKFANRAKNIKNEARVNEDLDQKSLLRKYERELKRLRAELEEKSRNVVDKRRLLELDEQRRRAEEDKMAAIRALEERSREFMREKEEKKKLEQRISMLTSQMLMSSQRRPGGGGGGGGGAGAGLLADGRADGVATAGGIDTEDPLIREAIREHQDRIRKEYECRLADLEKERETIEEEKAQVDRYKQLLLKQRDIMIALTQRLNERDEQITALQDELDASDRHQKELEEKLDEKTAHLIHLQRVTMEHRANSPGKSSAELVQALGDWAASGEREREREREGGGDASAPPASRLAPELLITHRQFRPHGTEQVILSNNSSSGVGLLPVAGAPASGSSAAAGGGLLSAEEKIQELKALVEAQSQEQARMAKELEEVKSEKVSVEFLLRERVERLVQGELETRLSAAGGNNAGAAGDARKREEQLERQLETLAAENQRLREAPARQSSASASASAETTAHARELQTRCERLVKERRAVQTIMEHKIKALVSAIGEASEAALQAGGGVARLGEPATWLAREVHALERLVNASILALRNADAGSHAAVGSSGDDGGGGGGGGARTETAKSSGSGSTWGDKLSHTSGAAPTIEASLPPSLSSSRTSTVASSTYSGRHEEHGLPPSATDKPSEGASLTVDELIQQRRAQLQLQRERQSLSLSLNSRGPVSE